MKNLSPRQQAILDLFENKKNISVAEIQQAVGISMATAYREIQVLTNKGLAAKTVGGISRTQNTPGNCLQCGREYSPRESFIFEKKDGTRSIACCPHCGLMAVSQLTDVVSAMTTDFFYGTMINAAQAWFVINSSISPCCQPSVLTFSSQNDAQRFAQAFGGELASLPAAIKMIADMMKL